MDEAKRELYIIYVPKMSILLIYHFCSVDRIYPKEHFKDKYAVDEVYYTCDVSVCECVGVCVLL